MPRFITDPATGIGHPPENLLRDRTDLLDLARLAYESDMNEFGYIRGEAAKLADGVLRARCPAFCVQPVKCAGGDHRCPRDPVCGN